MANWLEKAYWNAFTLWHSRGEARFPYRPEEDLLAVQSKRVRAIISHAYGTVPFYREAMDRLGLKPADFAGAGDLARLPLVTGRDLAESPERFLSSSFLKKKTLELTTTGTVGLFKGIHHDPAGLFMALAAGGRQRAVLARFTGRRLGYREVAVVREGSTGPVIREFYESHSWVPKSLDVRRRVASPAESYGSNLEVINSFEPEVIIGFGSYIGGIFRHARESDRSMHRPAVVLYGGDLLHQPDRRLIEDEFGIPVLSSYQACESLRIAFQCERREGFHVSLDQAAVRVVDREGKTLGPGAPGEIVLSNLVNRATVLLNYRMGDVAAWSGAPCPCGRTLPTLERMEGRTEDLILRPDGETVHQSVTLPLLYGVPGVLQVQVRQESLREIVMSVVCKDGADYQETRAGLIKALSSTMGEAGGLDIAVERVSAIPHGEGGKFRAVISNCAGRSPDGERG